MQPEGQKQKDVVICEYFVTSQINRQKSKENWVIYKKENLRSKKKMNRLSWKRWT